MLRIAICDDESIHLDHTASAAEAALAGLAAEIRRFSSSEELLRALDDSLYCPDIALLDIELGGLDGIGLADSLNRLRPNCCIIYITGYLRYAPEVYSTEHTWFILKSEVRERIGPALKKAIASIEARKTAENAFLTIRNAGRVTVLPLCEVLYLERSGRKTIVVTDGGQYETYAAPAELLDGLSEDSFIRCHQSFYGNAKRIRSLEKTDLILDNGTPIPISRSYSAAAAAAFFEELRRR